MLRGLSVQRSRQDPQASGDPFRSAGWRPDELDIQCSWLWCRSLGSAVGMLLIWGSMATALAMIPIGGALRLIALLISVGGALGRRGPGRVARAQGLLSAARRRYSEVLLANALTIHRA